MKSKGYCKKKKKDERSHYAEWLETKMTEKMSIDKCKIMHMTIIKLSIDRYYNTESKWC